MSQRQFQIHHVGPLEWVEDDSWGLLSKCCRFAIRGHTVNGKAEFVVWRRGRDGRDIPKSLGMAPTREQAIQIAEEAKFDPPPSWHGPR